MNSQRFLLITTAWLLYITFTILMYPYVGISVMLPSILLCGFSTLLFGIKGGIVAIFLTHPYHVLVMIYHLESFHGWQTALEPRGVTGGVAAQIGAVLFVSMIKNNYAKIRKINEELEVKIEQRNKELQRITEYIMVRSETERSLMSEHFFDIATQQLTKLHTHSLILKNGLTTSCTISQIESASKLVQLAELNIENVTRLRRGLLSKEIVERGIQKALEDMCTNVAEASNTEFKISVKDPYQEISSETALNVYRISHEAVTNALRHGKATHISICLQVSDGICTLEVLNNGNPLSDPTGEGLGMRLIQQRAEIINAKINLESTENGETRLKCVVPLRSSTLSVYESRSPNI